MEFVIMPREDRIGELVAKCARKELPFGDLCKQVAAMGYKTTSLFEMVVAAEYDIKAKP